MGQCPVFTGIASALQKYQFDPYLWRVCAWVVQILQVFSLEPNHAWFVIVIHTKLTSGRFHIIRHCEGLVSSIYTTFAQRTLTAGSDDMLTCDTVDLKQLNRFTPRHRRRLTLNYEGGKQSVVFNSEIWGSCRPHFPQRLLFHRRCLAQHVSAAAGGTKLCRCIDQITSYQPSQPHRHQLRPHENKESSWAQWAGGQNWQRECCKK